MEKTSIIIAVFNKWNLTLQCLDFIREHNDKNTYEMIVVDNGSTDKTPEVLSGYGDIVYIRNERNSGISPAYNRAVKEATCPVLCFMHNDVFVSGKGWIPMIAEFLRKTDDAGIVGLYGAKTIRKDGSFRGKTIIHAKKRAPLISRPWEKVAVVDGLLLAMRRSVFEQVNGFHEEFTVHYYDKDISMRTAQNKLVNYVLHIPFEHLCSSTRKDIAEENTIRLEAQKKFVELWGHFLPFDITTVKERIRYALRLKGSS
jgi:GT2 family glycosyltransferase